MLYLAPHELARPRYQLPWLISQFFPAGGGGTGRDRTWRYISLRWHIPENFFGEPLSSQRDIAQVCPTVSLGLFTEFKAKQEYFVVYTNAETPKYANCLNRTGNYKPEIGLTLGPGQPHPLSKNQIQVKSPKLQKFLAGKSQPTVFLMRGILADFGSYFSWKWGGGVFYLHHLHHKRSSGVQTRKMQRVDSFG